MCGSGVSILILEDGQAIRIIADPRHGRDDGARTKVDHPHRPARRGVGSEARPAGDDRVASVQRDRGALRAARADLTIRIRRTGARNAGDFRAWLMGESLAQVDDRHIVRAVIRDDDLASVGRPGERERPCLPVGIVGPDAHAGRLGAGRAGAGAIHVDDRDAVAFEVGLSASRAVTAMNLPFGLALMPKGPVCTGTRGATSTTGTPISARWRSITDTSSVPALPEKR